MTPTATHFGLVSLVLVAAVVAGLLARPFTRN